MRRLVRALFSPALLGACVTGLVIGGIAVAAIPQQAVISGCYQKRTGALRVIHASKHGAAGRCGKTERKLAWAQAGPTGPQGVQGVPGVQGVQGVQGAKGAQGVPGPVTTSAPTGSTQVGAFAAEGTATGGGQYVAVTSISFPLTLASAPTIIELSLDTPSTTNCPGTPAVPAAAPGYLCLYFDTEANLHAAAPGYDLYAQVGGGTVFGASAFGTVLSAESAAAGEVYAAGSWAVTAK